MEKYNLYQRMNTQNMNEEQEQEWEVQVLLPQEEEEKEEEETEIVFIPNKSLKKDKKRSKMKTFRKFLVLFSVMIIWSLGILMVIFLIDYFFNTCLFKYILLIIGIFLLSYISVKVEDSEKEKISKAIKGNRFKNTNK